MRYQRFVIFCSLMFLLLIFCGTAITVTNQVNAAGSSSKEDALPASISPVNKAAGNGLSQKEKMTMEIRIGKTAVSAAWEQNEAVSALMKLAEKSPLTIKMSMYGGFEQVGSIGRSLPRNDRQMTAQAGDIMLYSGNQLVVFYGSNSWAYTKLGRITGLSQELLKELLSNGDVTVTLFSGKKENSQGLL